MDEYGGPAAPPRPPKPAAVRVHRPATDTRPANAANHRPTTVSLQRPRPDCEREGNAYVEAPRRTRPPPAPHKPPLPITSQPDKRRTGPLPDSIVCAECGRCRCEQCARPRPLPSRWLCDWCLCSAEAVVDYASCMCCVKALFYHCGGGEGDDGVPEPCACGGRGSAARWGCMAALATVLPCLCLYWPLRACAACGARLYSRATRSGCRCPTSSII